jgi:hypothetical protein
MSAAIYAEGEELAERLGQSFNSTELEYDLMKPDKPFPDELIAIMEQIRSERTQRRDAKHLNLLAEGKAAEQEGGAE